MFRKIAKITRAYIFDERFVNYNEDKNGKGHLNIPNVLRCDSIFGLLDTIKGSITAGRVCREANEVYLGSYLGHACVCVFGERFQL